MIPKVVLLLFVMPMTACALDQIDDDAVATDEQSIIGGTIDTGDPSVVAIFAQGSMCTGTVIGPRTVLTAAHCISSYQAFEIRSGTTPTLPGINATSWVAHPSFDISNLWGGHDVGILHTAAPLPFPPVALAPVALAQPVRLVGYGHETHDLTGAGTKRQVTTNITWSNNLHIGNGNSDQQICLGDSGGPAFQTINGRLVVVGIASFTFVQPGVYCINGGAHSRVDADLGFITANTF